LVWLDAETGKERTKRKTSELIIGVNSLNDAFPNFSNSDPQIRNRI
jgi:hypothetical protein